MARLWTIYKFVDKLMPLVFSCGKLLDDITNFLTPRLLECSDLKCTYARDRQTIPHNKEMVNQIVRKFVSPMLRNYAQVQSELHLCKPIVDNKPNKRKYLKITGRPVNKPTNQKRKAPPVNAANNKKRRVAQSQPVNSS